MATVSFTSYPSQTFSVQAYDAVSGDTVGSLGTGVTDTTAPGMYLFPVSATGIVYVVATADDYTVLGYANLDLTDESGRCSLRDTYDDAGADTAVANQLDAIQAKTDLINTVAPTVETQVPAGTITAKCGVDLDVTATVSVPANWEKGYFTVKERLADTDAQAVVQILVTSGGAEGDGLIRLNRQAPSSAALGALEVAESLDSVTITISASATVKLAGKKTYYYDIKFLCDDDTAPYICDPGDFITRDLVTDVVP